MHVMPEIETNSNAQGDAVQVEIIKDQMAECNISNGQSSFDGEHHHQQSGSNGDNDAVDVKTTDSESQPVNKTEDDGGEETRKSEFTLSTEVLKAKMEQESLEFAFLKPICAEVLRNPSVKNLKLFEEALDEVGKVPTHLTEFIMFPFAIHTKLMGMKNYKETQRIQIFHSFAKLLEKTELRSNSHDMFVNIFQKLNCALTLPSNPSKFNTKLSDEEAEAILTCIKYLTINSLSYNFDTLCQPDNVKIIGHSVFVLLQLVALTVSKSIRVMTLDTLQHFVKLCDGSELRSGVLFQFLPGIVSGLRKLSLPSAGNSVKAIVIKSLGVMGPTIRISTEFEDPVKLEQADSMLSKIVDLLSQEFVLNQDVDYRKSFFEFCCEITIRQTQLPNCYKTVSTILMRMKEDDESSISSGCAEALQNGGLLETLSFEDLTGSINSALLYMTSGNESACVLTLREISSTLSTKKLTFIELQAFLPLLCQFMNEIVWKLRSVTVDNKKTSDPTYAAACRVCQNLVLSCDLDEVVFELISTLHEMQCNLQKFKCPTGVVVVFNVVLPVIHEINPLKITDFEASNLAEMYLSLLDVQSTEVAIQTIENDIPAVQTAANIRKCYLLEGLGILGKLYPDTVIPLILYPLIEHAETSFQNSEVVNEVAEAALKQLAGQQSLDEFLKKNLGLVLNEISVRMLNLSLYPNCPHALAFLANYFDFSELSFASLVDQIFERCSDEFGGGSVQHIYVKVFYALLNSIFRHNKKEPVSSETTVEKPTLLQKMLAYQKAVGVTPKEMNNDDSEGEVRNEKGGNEAEDEAESEKEVLSPVMLLVERISHRLLNFLPNNDRNVRLVAMDSLILGVQLLANHEDSLLPLSHSIWQNLIPRIDERDYVIVRKSFELLQTMCSCSGEFLRKRTIDEAFPRLSVLLLSLAKEGEQIKDKNRQYYTCTQAYKLQLTILQGLATLLHNIDVQAFELDKIVSGCILYLKPNQHKNLREAAKNLLKEISTGKHCRTVWMKLMANGIIEIPSNVPDTSFTPLPHFE